MSALALHKALGAHSTLPKSNGPLHPKSLERAEDLKTLDAWVPAPKCPACLQGLNSIGLRCGTFRVLHPRVSHAKYLLRLASVSCSKYADTFCFGYDSEYPT